MQKTPLFACFTHKDVITSKYVVDPFLVRYKGKKRHTPRHRLHTEGKERTTSENQFVSIDAIHNSAGALRSPTTRCNNHGAAPAAGLGA